MKIIRKEVAPLSDHIWKEIKDQAKSVMDTSRTVRKFADINGPYGPEFAAVSTGRFKVPRKSWKSGINYGVREVLPLVEVRIPFELDLWELENIERGAKDADLDNLDTAVKSAVNLEENVVYSGLKTVGIKGLEKSSKYPIEKLPENPSEILKFIGAQINRMQQSGVEGPYSLVLEEGYWLELVNLTDGYPIIQQLKDLLKGQIIVNNHFDKSFLVSKRGGDYELTIGQDTLIGYDSCDTRKINLFVAESFTFRVLAPEAVIVMANK
jgi:uncharacterized linocin/CFP29 family protein